MNARPRRVLVAALVLSVAAAGVVTAAQLPGGPGGPVGPATGGADGADGALECSYPFYQTDATNTIVEIPEEPERVVTLAPSAAQTMWEIGGKSQVVGVSQHASYLAGADSRRNVSGSGYSYVNLEVVVALDPDLVLAPNVIPEGTVTKLREAGLTVYKFRPATGLDSIVRKTELTGKLTGNCEGAAETAASLRAELDTVSRAVEGEDRPRVLYVFYGYTAGEGTFIDTIITAAGGTNVAAERNISGYQAISQEVVADANPEWLVLNSDQPSVPDGEAYQGTDAVRNDQVVTVNASYVSQPGPRVIQPVRKLAKAFHPEAYAAAVSTPTPTSTPPGTTTVAVDDTPTASESPSPNGGSTPGFGLGGALVALVAIALLGRRAT